MSGFAIQPNQKVEIHFAGVSDAQAAFSGASARLGPTGVLVLPNRNVITGVDLSRMGMASPADRQRMLTTLSGDPNLRLADFTAFIDDFVAQGTGQNVTGQQVNIPPKAYARMTGSQGSYGDGTVDASADAFVLGVSPLGTPVDKTDVVPPAPVPAPPPPAPAPPPPAAAPEPPAAPAPAATADARPTPAEDRATVRTIFRRIADSWAVPADILDHPGGRSAGLQTALSSDLIDNASWSRLRAALGRMSKDEVTAQMRAALASPKFENLSREDREQIADIVVEALLSEEAQDTDIRMQRRVVSSLRNAANEMRALADDPERLARYCRATKRLEAGSEADRKIAKTMRDGLGLTDVDLDDGAAAAAAVRARADICAKGAEDFETIGPGRLARTIAKLDRGRAMAAAVMGAEPDSAEAEAVDMAISRGKTDATINAAAAFATGIAAGLAVGAIAGPGVYGFLAGVATSAVTGLPELVEMREAVDRALAEETSGVAPPGAGAAARRNAKVATVFYALKLAVPAGLAKGVEHIAAEKAAEKAFELGLGIFAREAGEVAGKVAEKATDLAVDVALDVLEGAIEAEGEGGVGLNAVQIANIEVGRQSLTNNRPLGRALNRAFDNAGVATDLKTRTTLVALYLAEHGPEIAGMTPADLDASLSAWLRANGTVGEAT